MYFLQCFWFVALVLNARMFVEVREGVLSNYMNILTCSFYLEGNTSKPAADRNAFRHPFRFAHDTYGRPISHAECHPVRNSFRGAICHTYGHSISHTECHTKRDTQRNAQSGSNGQAVVAIKPAF